MMDASLTQPKLENPMMVVVKAKEETTEVPVVETGKLSKEEHDPS